MQKRYASILVMALAGWFVCGCDASGHMRGWSQDIDVGGPDGVHVHQGAVNPCAGRIALTQGSMTVRNLCFTGETNVVLCTDATAANPVKCSAELGALNDCRQWQ